MKADELMVGDFVFWNNKVAEVDTLWRGQQTVKVTLFDRERFQDVFLSDVQPITITPKILEKNGFVRLKGKNIYFDLNLALRPMGFSGPYKIGDTMMFVEYVHELQHALRLCKIDKEIIL